MGIRSRGLFFLLAAGVAACAADIVVGPLQTGTWGGNQGNLSVFADSATLDLPCAAGRIPHPLVTDSTGKFDLSGFWAPMVGPVRIDGPDWQPARFQGLRTDNQIRLLIILETGNAPPTIGPLLFTRDVVGHFPRCL